jgi:hypothetical protein
MSGRCCVFQPFDKGPHDKRYEDTIVPAIQAAGLEPYRVDRDDGAAIPIDTLHAEIKSSTLCLADITTRNANVMYELGYAIASEKDVVLICSTQQSDKFPFDIQHRGIVQYSPESASDFEKLKSDITNRIKALLKKQETTQDLASVSPVKSTQGLQSIEIAALAFVMANVDSSTDCVGASLIKQDMERAGYTRLASQLALTRLSRMEFVKAADDADHNGNPFVAYQILQAGEDWLLENQDKLELRVSMKSSPQQRIPFDSGITDDDVPF